MNTLDSFDALERRRELERLVAQTRLPSVKPVFNLHSHTFFSYNAYGYSPSHFAWKAREAGHEFAGIVDFDVLDGLDEFLSAGALLELKTTVCIETRVFLPSFADRVVNSPGEPGLVYHMGVGFTSTDLPPKAAAFLQQMSIRAARRNQIVIDKVNAVTTPLRLDYEADVLPLTPKGNATERHICLAYARKAAECFPNEADLLSYWSDRLGGLDALPDGPTGGALQTLIRAKLMKRGGVGYVQPDRDSFPGMAAMNEFVLESGAIPTLAWLDGTSDGEQASDELLDSAIACGTAGFALIPDRNYTPGMKDQKLANLYDMVDRVTKRGLPVFIGTEMNAPGQKFVDDFDAPELAPLIPIFLTGARIAYAHTVLQRKAGMGYLSDWADSHFSTAQEKNEFYETVGRCVSPAMEEAWLVDPHSGPKDLLDRLERTP